MRPTSGSVVAGVTCTGLSTGSARSSTCCFHPPGMPPPPRRFFTRMLIQVPRPAEVTTDRAPVYLGGARRGGSRRLPCRGALRKQSHRGRSRSAQVPTETHSGTEANPFRGRRLHWPCIRTKPPRRSPRNRRLTSFPVSGWQPHASRSPPWSNQGRRSAPTLWGAESVKASSKWTAQGPQTPALPRNESWCSLRSRGRHS
jgi:hypothetical protein